MVNESVGTSPKRRDRLLIIADILATTKDGSLKTQIMYRANLSFAQLSKYLNFLLKRNLLKVNTGSTKTFYKTTSKGVKYLEIYGKISNLLRRGKGNPVEAKSPTFWPRALH